MELGTSFPNDSNCTAISKERQEIVFFSKLAASSFGVVVTIIAIIVLLICRSYRLLVFRILLYITIANLLQVIMQLLELFPIENQHDYNEVKEGWTPFCRVFGFLDQLSSWMGPLCMLWMVLYVYYLGSSREFKKHMDFTLYELIGIALCFFFPFTFCWIPFIDDYYGFSGSWCWIKATRNECNDTNITTGLVYILVIYYVPLAVFVVVNTIVCFMIIILLCEKGSAIAKKAVIFIVMYPFIYDVLFVIVAISRLDSIVSIKGHREQSYVLWIAHAVADPARVILPSMLVIIQWFFPFTRELVKNLDAETKKAKGTEKARLLDHQT